MTDTARDLIQRLADALAEWQLGGAPPEDTSDADLIDEARAFLSKPEPEELTDEEILDLSVEHGVSYITLGGFVIHPYQEVVDIKDYVLSFACALIAADRARWGRPAVEPVPVSERPWEREGWCDNNGWCWGFDADDTDPFWSFDRPETCACWTHLLPYYALPIPAPTEKP